MCFVIASVRGIPFNTFFLCCRKTPVGGYITESSWTGAQ